jgi:hypothetical protein
LSLGLEPARSPAKGFNLLACAEGVAAGRDF